MYVFPPFYNNNCCLINSLFFRIENPCYKLYEPLGRISQGTYYGYGFHVHPEYVRFEYGSRSFVHIPIPSLFRPVNEKFRLMEEPDRRREEVYRFPAQDGFCDDFCGG